jgi:sugar lactone lactonase YvrE
MDYARLGDVTCTVGESPLWSAGEHAWYWVDIPARRIWRHDTASDTLRHWHTSEMVACLALCETGGFIAGMESGLFHLTLGQAQKAGERRLAAPATLGPGMRFNDGRCDRQGRFWSGTMFMDMAAERAVGQLFRYDADQGLSAPQVSALLVQNGLCWSPDGGTMYLSDSHPARQLVWAFDVDIDSGNLSRQRVFVDMRQYPGRPDGAAMDTDGCYWICGNDGSCVLRFTPDGKLDRQIDLPMTKPAMCAFGGDDLQTLLVTSIVPGQPAQGELAGAVITLRPGAQGMPEPRFRG